MNIVENTYFGKGIAQLQEKKLKALYEMDAPVLDKPSKYEWVAIQSANPSLIELIMGTKSVDDVLTEMESSVNAAVIAAKAKEVEE
ncbi:hypothetical protein [Paenibacillus sp. IHBB 10380]|uniref:hypothetical protein n=1 Tax=Paenibacillus sp. IHBB 10380 TaxID=1566358 RepID=UPI0005CFE931|nr:hypothetical protein [Paenibacillus sp. IHBB 10380]AJS58934.1 hypothetical protein UB51_11105 [Paenibacillus sp. IHBB 10380]